MLLFVLFSCWSVVVNGGSTTGRTYQDKELHARIPERLKREVEKLVESKLNQMLTLHYDATDDIISTSSDQSLIINNEVHGLRNRRDVNDSATIPQYSEWTVFGYCSVKCGGGIRVRSRQCLNSECPQDGLLEQQACGNLPCVSGSYVLEDINPQWKVLLNGSVTIKFFVILNQVFLGKLMEDSIEIYEYRLNKGSFDYIQNISVQNGVSFTLLETEYSVYLVILEKFSGHFFGVSSRMYMYDPAKINGVFDIYQPIYFKVYEPSAISGFEIYGKPYLAVVNKRNKELTNGNSQTIFVCNSRQRFLSCPAGNYISIVEAIYGRHNTWVCPATSFAFPYSQFFYWCNVGIKDKIMDMCEDKSSCTIDANPTLLLNGPDPCPFTDKYVKIIYSCSSLSYTGTPIFYEWTGVGLSVVGSEDLQTSGAEDLESFHIHDTAYVAVANHINDQGEHHLDSEVYIFDLARRKFRSFQKLRTDGAIDIEFFVIGQGISREYFLAVANHVKNSAVGGGKVYEVDSIIYKWNWNIFVPFQCVKTYGAKKWTAVSGKDGEFLLTMTNMNGIITFYSYDGWRFHLTKKQPTDLEDQKIFQNAVTTASISINTDSQSQILLAIQPSLEFASSSDINNIYSLQFKQVFPNFDLLENTLQAVQQMNYSVYQELLPRAESFNVSFNKATNDIVFLEDVINLTGNTTFKFIEVHNTTYVDRANVGSINLSPNDNELGLMLSSLETLEASYDNRITSLEGVTTNSVTWNTTQFITGNISFTKNLTFEKLLVSGNITVGNNTNGRKLFNEYRDSLFANRDENISSEVVFNKQVKFESLTIADKINNISTNGLVSTSKQSNITGQKIFEDLRLTKTDVLQNLEVVGKVDGVNTNNLVLLHKDQEIQAKYTFLGNTTFLKDYKGLINGMNIGAIASDTLLKNQDAIVKVHKNFSEVIVKGDLDMADEKTINDVDISNLTANGIYLDARNKFGDVIFTGNVTFQDSISLGSGSLNGLQLDEIVFTDQVNTFQKPFTFYQNVTCQEDITVDGTVNNFNLSVDIMDVQSNQTINGAKNFTKQIAILGNLDVAQHIDGVDIEHLLHHTMKYNVTQNVTGHKTLDTLSTSNIKLLECTEESCPLWNIISKLKTDTVKKSDQNIIVKDIKTFADGSIIRGNLTVNGTIAGVELPGDFLLQGVNQTVNATYTFNNVSFTNNLTMDNFNGVNLTELYQRVLRKSGNSQIVTERWIFNDSTTFNRLSVNGNVDGVNLSRDGLLTNQNHSLTGQKTFYNGINIEKLYVKNMTVSGLIDGVNLTALKEDLLTKYSDDIIVTGTKVFENHVSFAGNVTILGLIDGVNISDLNSRAMKLDSDQIVTGKKIFEAEVQVEMNDFEIDGLIDGVNLTELYFSVINKNSTLMIKNNITVGNITVIGNTTVASLFNGINLTKVYEEAVWKDGDQTIYGPIITESVTIHGDLEVKGLVNGHNFTQDVILLDQPGHITSHLLFKDPVTVNNNTIANFLNGHNLTELFGNIVLIDENTTISGNKSFTSNIVVQELLQKGLINNVNLTDLIATTLLKTANQTITVSTSFMNLVLNAEADANLVNGINLNELERNLIYRCQGPARSINGSHKYLKAEVMSSSSIANITTEGLVDSVNLTQFSRDLVTKDGNHTITGKKNLVFLTANHLEVDTINGYKFPDAFIGINETNVTIYGVKTFEGTTTVKNNVSLLANKTVNGRDFSEHAQNIVSLHGNDVITTDVVFTEYVTVNGNLDVGTINNVTIAEKDLLLRTGNVETVTGKKNFSQLTVQGDVTTVRDINGFNLNTMYSETILADQENVITGSKTINGSVYVLGNLETQLVDTVNVTTMFSSATTISNYLTGKLDEFEDSVIKNQQTISQLSQAISDIRQKIDYFIHHQKIPLNYQSISMDVFQDGANTWLAAGALRDVYGANCANMTLFKGSTGDQFTEYIHLVTSSISGVRFQPTTSLSSPESFILSTSSSKMHGRCGYDALDASKTYMMSFEVSRQSNATYEFTALETGGGAAGLDILTSKSLNESYGIVYTSKSSMQSSISCVDQMFYVLGSQKRFIPVGNQTCEVVKSIIVHGDKELSMIAVLGKNTNKEPRLDLYRVSHPTGTEDADETTLVQTIVTYHAKDVISMETEEGSFIVVVNTFDSSEGSLTVSYTVPVVIYKLSASSGTYEHYQQLEIYGAYTAAHFKFGAYVYLALSTYSQNIVVLRHKGVNKWQEEIAIPIQGFNSVHAIQFWVDSDNELYLGILSDDEWDDFHPSSISISRAIMSSGADGEDIKKLMDLSA